MINVSQAWKDNIYNAAAEKKIIFTVGATTFGDNDIQDKVEIQETCTNGSDIKIGSCIASSLKFSLTNKGLNVDFANNEINVQVGIKIPSTGEFEFVPMGIFKVNEIDKTDERVFKIVAYDRMKLFEKDCTEFLATRTYPITLWSFSQQLCGYVGIELENTSITNGDYLIEENFKATDFTSQQLLTWIGEVAASFINVNRYGKLVFKSFSKVTNNVTDRDYINFTVAKHTVPQITRVQVAVEEDDLGVIVGTGNVTYAIINNPLLYTKSTAQITPVITNILTALNSIPIYAPCKLYGKGNPAIETGDIITVTTVKGVAVDIMVMDRKFVYAKSFRDTYESFGTAIVGAKRIVQNSLIQLKGKMNILTRTLEKNVLKVADLEIGHSQLTQTVDNLSLEVSNITTNATYYQYDTPATPKKGELWYRPKRDYTVDALLMTVDEMTMTVDELITTESKMSRWNGTAWETIEDTETIRNVSELSLRADAVELKVQNAEGNISELIQTSTSLTSRITNAEGNISTVTQTANSLETRVSGAEGNISTLTQTANSLETRVSNAEGNVSTLTQTANSLETRVSGTEGNISTIKQTTDSIALAVNASKLIFNSSGLTVQNGGLFIKDGSNNTLLSSESGNLYLRGELRTGYVTVDSTGVCVSPYISWNGSPSGGRLWFDRNNNRMILEALGWSVLIRTSMLEYGIGNTSHNFRGGDLDIVNGDLQVKGERYTKKKLSEVKTYDYVLSLPG